MCIFKQQKIIGVYTELFFEVSVYIKRYENKGRGKEKSNKKVSTSTLFSLYITKYHKNIFYFHARLLKITFILPHNIWMDFYFNALLTSNKTNFYNTTPCHIYISLILPNFLLLLFNQVWTKSLLF